MVLKVGEVDLFERADAFWCCLFCEPVEFPASEYLFCVTGTDEDHFFKDVGEVLPDFSTFAMRCRVKWISRV